MKKILSIMLAAVMSAICLTACGDSSSTADSKNSNSSSSSSVAETTTTTTSKAETTTTTTEATTTTQETTTTQQTTSKVERVGIPYNAAKILTANTNAKLVFTTLNTTASDMIADGESVDSVMTDKPVPVDSFKDSTDPLLKAVYEAFNRVGTTNYGYVFIHFDLFADDDAEQTPNFVQWSEDPTGTYIGQYLNPVDATNWSSIQFGIKQ